MNIYDDPGVRWRLGRTLDDGDIEGIIPFDETTQRWMHVEESSGEWFRIPCLGGMSPKAICNREVAERMLDRLGGEYFDYDPMIVGPSCEFVVRIPNGAILQLVQDIVDTREQFSCLDDAAFEEYVREQAEEQLDDWYVNDVETELYGKDLDHIVDRENVFSIVRDLMRVIEKYRGKTTLDSGGSAVYPINPKDMANILSDIF